MFSMTIRVLTGLTMLRPVTGGVPLPQGAVSDPASLVLRDEAGHVVPLQVQTLTTWEDDSAQWVLLDFQSQSRPDVKYRTYTLTCEKEPPSVIPSTPVTVQPGARPSIASGPLSLTQPETGLLSIDGRLDVDLTLVLGDGTTCRAKVESAKVETTGPVRCMLALRGAFHRPGGQRAFQFRIRATLFAGLKVVRIEPMILVDAPTGVMQHIRELKLTVRPVDGLRSASFGGKPGWQGKPEESIRLFQVDDKQHRIEPTGDQGGRAPGWATLTDGKGTVAVAVRDFWQQWPKSIEAAPTELAIGLLPPFTEGTFDHMQPWYKYLYLFEGDGYRLRTGQARRWDIWLDLGGDAPALAETANAPLVPIAEPKQAIATGVWGAIRPAGTPAMAKYDPWAENLFDAYCAWIDRQRDYGAMNWGDWHGERIVNWGNHEYDTTKQILIQYARTGEPKYLYVADAAARHSAEVDTIHFVNDDLAKHLGQSDTYPARAGMVHQHTVGHVSGFYPPAKIRELFVKHNIGNSKSPYLCLDARNLGHIWTEGTARQYLLTGDPFLKETVLAIGDNLAQLVEDRKYRFMGHAHCGRTTGWSLLALSGAYEITRNERHLKAMKTLVDDALAAQDPHCGGWLYKLGRGHCNCTTNKHVGMAGFITSVLINGLSRYYELTGDERLPEAIERATTFLDNDTWHEEWRDWRYTSCPATGRMRQTGVTMLAHVNAARIGKNPEHLRVLQVAWGAKFKRLLEAEPESVGMGKTFGTTLLGCAETVGLLAEHNAFP